MNPRLDAAMAAGYDSWESVIREIGSARSVAWASQRAGDDVPKDDLRDNSPALSDAEDTKAATFARAELAELVEENDDELADLLWERVLQRGRATDDPDLIFESSSHLAGIAEDMGELLAAAEYFVDFLNWRRQPSSVSEPEAVQMAFDEVIRLAELDGEPRIAAVYSFRQVQYTKLVDSEAEQATSGDWEKDRAPYASWS